MTLHPAEARVSHTWTKGPRYFTLFLINGLCIVTTNTRHLHAPATTRLRRQSCALNKLKLVIQRGLKQAAIGMRLSLTFQ